MGNPDLMGGEANGFVYAKGASAINVADGQSLGRGPEFYNNMAAPNNCVGGSETSCPATDPVPPAAPAHWYANGHNVSIADGQSLRGAEFYNNSSAPGNCVGGSETTCSPPGYPVPRGPGSLSPLPPSPPAPLRGLPSVRTLVGEEA